MVAIYIEEPDTGIAQLNPIWVYALGFDKATVGKMQRPWHASPWWNIRTSISQSDFCLKGLRISKVVNNVVTYFQRSSHVINKILVRSYEACNRMGKNLL